MGYQIELPDNVQLILEKLEVNGYEGYIVGGCVRDSLLGVKPHDWDICTNAIPTTVVELFSDYRVIETGLKHGTVTIVIADEMFEITTYRVDGIYTDGRRPDSITFTPSLLEDLKRRDFTINSIAYNQTVGLYDPFDGVTDIELKIIKCVGNPNARFEEDALRILRAFRFYCVLDSFSIEENTIDSMKNNIQLLSNVSAERVREEIVKSLSNTKRFCLAMNEYPMIFSYIVPEWNDMNVDQNNPYHIYTVDVHTLHSLAAYDGNDLIIKLAILFHDIGKPRCYTEGLDGIGHFYTHASIGEFMTFKILKRLKFDNLTIDLVTDLIEYHDAVILCSKKHVRRWLNRIGEEQFKRLLVIKRCDVCGQSPQFLNERLEALKLSTSLLEEIVSEGQCFTLKQLSIGGKDLLELGLSPGVEIGRILNEVLQKVIDGELENDKNTLIQYTKSYIQSNG